MSKHTTTFGGIGFAAAILAAAALTACTEYLDPRKGPPQVIGVMAADVNFNEVVPLNPTGGCTPPYPEPDVTKIPAGLCGGITSLCNPINCFPPRVGPGFAPLYTGGGSVSYPCSPAAADPRCTAGEFTSTVPNPEVYSLPGVSSAAYTDPGGTTFQFAQIRILFNKLMDGGSIQPNPATCAAPPGGGGAALTITANGVADNAAWTVCYVPNSPVSAWGATMTFNPNAGALTAATTYHITGTVTDQDGAALPVDVTVTTL